MGLDAVDSSTKADNDRIDHDAFPAENRSRRDPGRTRHRIGITNVGPEPTNTTRRKAVRISPPGHGHAHPQWEYCPERARSYQTPD